MQEEYTTCCFAIFTSLAFPGSSVSTQLCTTSKRLPPILSGEVGRAGRVPPAVGPAARHGLEGAEKRKYNGAFIHGASDNVKAPATTNDRPTCPDAAHAPFLPNGQKFLGMYLERRSNLKLLVLLADSRREPLAADAGVLRYAEDKEDRLYKILLVATKVCRMRS